VIKKETADATFIIVQPPPWTTGTPTVRARQDSSVGTWLICTQGSFPSGTPPRSVFAKIYNQGAPIDQTPPSGTMGQIVGANRTWGVSAPFELPVPQPTGTSTFVAWADYGDHFTRLDPPLNFNTNTTSGITECQAVSSGTNSSTGGVVKVPAIDRPIPKTLFAHISNTSALRGVYALLYDATTTSWTSDAICGTHGFRLRHQATVWQLTAKGATYQPAVAQHGPSGPFQIVFHNVDLRTPGGDGANAAVEILLT
jgi:hypothetical protein